MSKVNMVWSCSGFESQTIVRKGSDGELELDEYIPCDCGCRWLDIHSETLLDMVNLALLYGWQPQGAVLMIPKTFLYRRLAPDENVVDSYNPAKLADFKMVLKDDAAHWAEALEKACAAIEAGEAQFAFTRAPILFGERMTPQEFASLNRPADLNRVHEFIGWLKKGAFEFFYED